jgi:hypothetical protein
MMSALRHKRISAGGMRRSEYANGGLRSYEVHAANSTHALNPSGAAPSAGLIKMATYEFRYATLSGNAIRTTVMQCAADTDAIRKAHEIMKDSFATLEISEGDRPVFSQLC